MKELDLQRNFIKEKPKVEASQQKEQEYKLVYQGTIMPHEGHTLYEIDLKTKEVKEAEYMEMDYIFNPNYKSSDKIIGHGKVMMSTGKSYVSALNKANAIKKFNKGADGSKIDRNNIYLDL